MQGWDKAVAVLGLMILGIGSSHADVYQCNVGGRQKFQDTPCQGASSAGSALTVRAPTVMDASSEEQDPPPPDDLPAPAAPAPAPATVAASPVPAAQRCPVPDEKSLERAYWDNRVLMCMTPAQVLEAAGKYSQHVVCTEGATTVWFFPTTLREFPSMVMFTGGKLVQWGQKDCSGQQMR